MMDTQPGDPGDLQRQTTSWSTSNVTTAVVFATTFLLIYYNTRRRSGVPPGPPLVPVVGNLFSLAGGDVLKTIVQMRQKHGDVFSLYIGTELTVFLNGHDVIYDALVKKGSMFVLRPYSSFHKLVIRNPGVIYLNGKLWKGQRTLIFKAFNQLVFRNSGQYFNHVLEHEVGKLIHALDTRADDKVTFNIADILLVSVSNVISELLFKRNFDVGDKFFLETIKKIGNLAEKMGKMLVLCNCFPILAKFPGDVLKADFANKTYHSVIDSIRPFIEEAKEDLNTVVGLYCEEITKMEAKGDRNVDGIKHLEPTIYELFGAGSETTSITLLWIILYLMNNPSIQETIYEEISQYKGEERILSLSDAKQLPYCNAVIYEGMRISSVAPLGLPRTVPHDYNFRGFLIPENCTIVTNLHSALTDPAVWDVPEAFRPERFLNETRTEVVIPKQFIPFSIGQRSCLGESIARMELFMFLSSMIANFKFIPADENVPYDMDGVLGITWHPKPFQLKVHKR